MPYYSDNFVTLYHGDAREVLPTLGVRADLIATDPPFGLDREYSSVRRQPTVRIVGDNNTDLLLWMAGYAADVASPDSWAAMFCGWNANGAVQDQLTATGWKLKTVIVWDKLQPGIGVGVRDQHEFVVLASRGKPPVPWNGGNVWGVGGTRLPTRHPHQKPFRLMSMLVARLSDPGGLVVDPFMGSGSTIAAAKSVGRRAIGIETEERYCEIAATRCSQEVLGLPA